jgi:very-short-patch-repair endonuclease
MIIKYNLKLKELARELRRNATKSEVRLWQKLKRDQMHGFDFHRQKPIDEYIVDFFCNRLRLAIEVDGYSHEILEVWERDVKKNNRLNELGIQVLRFSDAQVLKDMDNVLQAIKEYIFQFEAKGNTPPSISPS